jgi:hypothetical protein
VCERYNFPIRLSGYLCERISDAKSDLKVKSWSVPLGLGFTTSTTPRSTSTRSTGTWTRPFNWSSLASSMVTVRIWPKPACWFCHGNGGSFCGQEPAALSLSPSETVATAASLAVGLRRYRNGTLAAAAAASGSKPPRSPGHYVIVLFKSILCSYHGSEWSLRLSDRSNQ